MLGHPCWDTHKINGGSGRQLNLTNPADLWDPCASSARLGWSHRTARETPLLLNEFEWASCKGCMAGGCRSQPAAEFLFRLDSDLDSDEWRLTQRNSAFTLGARSSVTLNLGTLWCGHVSVDVLARCRTAAIDCFHDIQSLKCQK